MFTPKCPLPALVAWCRTFKHSLGAGLNPVKVFRQQAKSGPRALRPIAADVAGRLEKGSSLADAFAPYHDRFPPLFVELVAVGETSGRLEETFDELCQYYEVTDRVRRDFRSQIMYPAIQFVAAVLIISALIFILGLLGSKMDPLGLGLTGTSGAVTFLVVAYGAVGGAVLAVRAALNSLKWKSRIEGFCLIVPAWGGALKAFAVHRFLIALRMTHEAGLRAEESLRYSFRATANSAFMRGTDRAVAVVKKGGAIYDALEASGAPFPDEVRDSILGAEEAGRMTEVCDRLAESYREEGSRRLKDAAQYTGWGLYALGALFVIAAIFGIFSQYVGALNNATRGM
ncbi:MAG TPA: type II secretion system F family protein [Urbifossiella sp.]|jgi:type IV pilus assembly protein PilC|nr:type II secretion system F family protein [Urbifossiella sp.]